MLTCQQINKGSILGNISFDEHSNSCRHELCRYFALALQRGLLSGSNGFLSVRIPESDAILVTPAGAFQEDFKPEDMLYLNLTDETKDLPESPKASPDVSYLIKSYKERREVSSICHFHPPHVTAYSNISNEIPVAATFKNSGLKEILWVNCKSCPSRYAGLCVCFEGRRKGYGAANILLIEEDGIVTLGRSLADAFCLADITEQNARVAYISSKLSNDTFSS